MGLSAHDTEALIYKDFFCMGGGIRQKFVTPTRDTVTGFGDTSSSGLDYGSSSSGTTAAQYRQPYFFGPLLVARTQISFLAHRTAGQWAYPAGQRCLDTANPTE